jgi:hypothetical protein
MPAFYNNPATIDDLLDHLVVRILDQFGLPAPHAHRWSGLADARSPAAGCADDLSAAIAAGARPSSQPRPARRGSPNSTR